MAKGTPQRLSRRTGKQFLGRWVEDRDALITIDADDGVQRGVDDGVQAVFAQLQLFIAVPQRRSALPKGESLCQQWALVDDGAYEMGQLILHIFNPGDVQVAGNDPA